jgi:hypothetical protein
LENLIFDDEEHMSNKKPNGILKYLEHSKTDVSGATENHDMSFEEVDFRPTEEVHESNGQ